MIRVVVEIREHAVVRRVRITAESNFYDQDPSYHEARHCFVHKLVGQTSPLPQDALTSGARPTRELRAS